MAASRVGDEQSSSRGQKNGAGNCSHRGSGIGRRGRGCDFFLRSGRSRLIRLQNETEKVRVQLDLLLEERQKQLPKLIETCRSYLSGEEALPALVKARALFGGAEDIQSRAAADRTLESALRGLFRAVEGRAEMKSNPNFERTREQLEDVELSLGEARPAYNTLAGLFNREMESFPSRLYVGKLGYSRKGIFEAGEE